MSQPQRPYRTPQRVPPRRPSAAKPRTRTSGMGRRTSGCGIALLAVLAIVCVGGVYAYNRLFGAINEIANTPEVRPTRVAAGPPPTILRDPFNVLVIGVDLRAGRTDEGARSDTLIVVHVDPRDKWASMLSIPRDTYAQIPNAACEGAGGTKINAAYSCGYRNAEALYGPGTEPTAAGAGLAAATVEQFLGIKIDYTAQVDFDGFQKLIDTLGGITLEVPRTILDAQYPTEDNGYMRLYIPAGLQRMDGTTALRYARTRHADSDFGRAQRQQQVLQAALSEVKRQGVLEQIEAAPQLLDVARTSIRTTLPIKDFSTLRGLAQLGQEIPPEKIQRLVLKPETLPDGTYSLQSDQSSVLVWSPAYVQRMAQQFQLPPGEPVPAEVVVQVQNGAGIPRLASNVTTDLDVRGYRTAPPTDAPENIPHTLILDYTGNASLAQQLAELLNVEAQYIRDASAEGAPPNIDIVVRLGQDYQPPTGSQSVTP